MLGFVSLGKEVTCEDIVRQSCIDKMIAFDVSTAVTKIVVEEERELDAIIEFNIGLLGELDLIHASNAIQESDRLE